MLKCIQKFIFYIVLVLQDCNEIKLLSRIFPRSRILICNFHSLKWMKTVFATALIPMEHKGEIMVAFRGLLFAKSRALFEEALPTWTEVVKGVEVKPRAGPQGKMVFLEEYFDNNWMSTIDMWAMYERNNLPIGTVNTNNHLERAWRTMKGVLAMLNPGLVNMPTAARNLVNWAEKQLRTRYTDSSRKVMQISDPDPALMQLYSEAAKELTKPGMMLFKERLQLMKKYNTSLVVLDDGRVEQVFKKETDVSPPEAKVYDTTETSCSCVSRRRNPSCPCYHTLFLRASRSLPLFEKGLFGDRFQRDLRTRDLDGQEVTENAATDVPADSEAVPDVPDEVEEEDKDDYAGFNDKFKIVNKQFGWMVGAICGHGKEQFKSYMSELRTLAQRARRGESLLAACSPSSEPDVKSGLQGDSENVQKEGCSADEAPLPKYKFQPKLKSRGRPSGTGAGPTNFYIPGSKANKQRGKSVARPKPQAAAKKRAGSEPRRKLSKVDVPLENSEQQVATIPSQKELQATRELVLCHYIPGVKGALHFTLRDYRMLQPGIWGTDAHIDFYLKYLEHTIDNYRMAVIQSLFYTQLDKNREVQNWLQDVPFWQVGGPELVLLPVCRHQHWVLLVAQLHPVQPLMFLLDSLGNSQEDAREARLFSNFLLSRRPAELHGSDFLVVVPRVPQQPNYDDCAFFAAKNAQMILRNGPEDFLDRIHTHANLSNWYKEEEMRGARRDLAELVEGLAREQREVEGLLEGTDLDIPEIDFMEVIVNCFNH